MGDILSKRHGYIRVILILIIAIMILYMVSQSVWFRRLKYPLDYTDLIIDSASEYSVDPHLVVAVIWVESRFRPQALSRRDAHGLMQITPSTGKWIAERIGLTDYNNDMLFDPEVNIRFGCWYLNHLLSQFDGNLELVLAAYNGGSGNVTRWLQNEEYSKDGKSLDYIPFPETRLYVEKVLIAHRVYKEIYPDINYL